jgi:hypothetical protein
VSVPREGQTPLIVSPAWISIRPGRHIELLEEVLTQDMDPEQHRLFGWGDEWIVSDGVKGPRRLEGNHLRQLLKDDEVRFAHFTGIDRRGRWLFRKSRGGEETLVLDSTVPDPTPRLPIWLLDIKKGKVGWEKNDWPVIKRPGAWYLNEHGWQGLDEKTNPMITTPPSMAAASESQPVPTTGAATLPATTQAATRASQPILVDRDGRKYLDGINTITVLEKSGKMTVWPLPPKAVGSGEVHLIRAKDGTLFLFNAPGRVLRIKPTPEAAQPFELDATFTHRVPNVDHFTRVWLDPANRIIMTYDTHMAILFAEGRIPRALQRLIPAMELEDQAP